MQLATVRPYPLSGADLFDRPRRLCYAAAILSEPKLTPAPPNPRASSPAGSSWGTARYATHLWVLVLALMVGALVPVGLRHPLREAAANARVDRPLLKSGAPEALLKPLANASRYTQVRPLTTYAVQPGDTVPTIAQRAALSLETLMQVNHLVSGDDLVTGELLVLPPVDGKMIRVEPGQSLAQIAQSNRIDPLVLLAVNNLTATGPMPAEVFIPAVSTDLPPARRVIPAPPSETRRHLVRFIWPAQATLTQTFWPYHPGIDLANPVGTPVVAADAGRVMFAGVGGYGIYVEIDHGNGFTTLYGHLSKTEVSAGELVSAGQLIGLMGMTGRATGPHLHFEVRYHGVPQNPLDLLP